MQVLDINNLNLVFDLKLTKQFHFSLIKSAVQIVTVTLAFKEQTQYGHVYDIMLTSWKANSKQFSDHANALRLKLAGAG